MYNNKISIIGTGYVGLVAGVCLADFGNNIINVDIDQEKIEGLQKGNVPIYEPGLKEMLNKNMSEERISFTTDIEHAIRESEVIFIAVGTPPTAEGSADLSAVKSVAQTIGKTINSYKVIVDKSTVPVGTGREVEKIILSQLKKRKKDYDFDVVSNPEFLREGKAVQDFTHPDRIIIGSDSEQAKEILQEVYQPLYLDNVPFVFTNLETAEVIKYTANSFLATKISFINEMSVLCDKVGANVKQVAKAIGMDDRIGERFLRAGPGYGGSCFPKDTKAIVTTAQKEDVELNVIKAGIKANQKQKEYMVDKIIGELNNLENKKIGVLGLSFKPGTDDMREAPALTILPQLIEQGAKIRAYDPEAMKNADDCLKEYQQDIIYCAHEYEVMKDAEALVLLTEWNQFRRLDLERVKKLMNDPVFFDLRNIYEPEKVREYGIEYIGVGVTPKAKSKEKIKNDLTQTAAK